LSTAYVSNSAAGFGKRERTAILRRHSGANGGWSFALTFCFFFVKEKENEKKLLDTFAKVSSTILNLPYTF
jgi:hypothetical protein